MHAIKTSIRRANSLFGRIGRILGTGAVALLSVGAIRGQTCEQLPKGILGWWAGDGSAMGLTSSANDGTLMNGATFATGVDGQGFSFDGVNDRVDIPDAASLRPAVFSLLAWIKLTSLSSSCIICKQAGSGDANSFNLWTSGGVLRGGMFRYAEAVGTTQLPLNRFVHTAVTFDGLVIRVYVDGRLIATAAGPASAVPYDANQVIIGAHDNGTNTFQGFLENLRDWRKVCDDLDALCDLELTSLDSPEPDLAYIFKHIVTQEVAYETLPFETRAVLHEQIGRFIERVYPGMLDQYLDLLAYHYDRSENQDKKREFLPKAGVAARPCAGRAKPTEESWLPHPFMRLPESTGGRPSRRPVVTSAPIRGRLQAAKRRRARPSAIAVSPVRPIVQSR